jgi:hypothetical protein
MGTHSIERYQYQAKGLQPHLLTLPRHRLQQNNFKPTVLVFMLNEIKNLLNSKSLRLYSKYFIFFITYEQGK